MSTGLTYVFISDASSSLQPHNGGTFIFNDYHEAYKHGEWLMNFGADGVIEYTIWTSGPNQNGFWVKITGTPTFVPLE